jgi:Uma2 family endonuclease
MKTQLYLTPADHGRPLTLEEFTQARGQEGYRYEIIRGRLEVSPAPNLPHEVLRKRLERLLDRYAEQHPEVFNWVQAPGRVFLPEAVEEDVTAPEPDLACYRDFPRLLPLTELDWRDVSPLLVIEVLSEDTADKDLERNRRLYVQVPSIQEYWLLDPRQDPDQPTLLVYRRRGQRWGRVRTVLSGGLYTTPLLPGFCLVMPPPP